MSNTLLRDLNRHSFSLFTCNCAWPQELKEATERRYYKFREEELLNLTDPDTGCELEFCVRCSDVSQGVTLGAGCNVVSNSAT